MPNLRNFIVPAFLVVALPIIQARGYPAWVPKMPAKIASPDILPPEPKKVISILAAVNYKSPLYPMGTMCTKAMEIALDQIRLSKKVLSDYNIELELTDDQNIVRELNENDKASHRIPLVIGPLCTSNDYLGLIYRHYNVVGVTGSTSNPEVKKNRDKFKSFYVLGSQPLAMFHAAAKFILSMGWRRVAILSEITSGLAHPMESALFDEMSKGNVTSGPLRVFQFLLSDALVVSKENDIEEMVSKLAAVNVRVVVALTDTPQLVACWMFRYGLYGPGYTIISPFYSTYTVDDTLVRYPWCTKQILFQMLQSTIFFGWVPKPYLQGSNATDWSGMTSDTYDMILRPFLQKGAKMEATWRASRYTCYEEAMFAAVWLDATENILRSRNQTLSDWITHGRNFRENGREYRDLMEKSISTFRMQGLSGDYEFEEVTADNTLGFLPIVFVQNQLPLSNGRLETNVVAYLNANGMDNESLTMGPNGIIWRTKTGAPHSDSITILDMPISIVSFIPFSILAGFSSLMICLNCLVLLLQIYKRKKDVKVKQSTPAINNLILVGNCVLLSHASVLPWDGENVGVNEQCKLVFFLVLIGASIVFSALVAKLELTLWLLKRPKLRVRCSIVSQRHSVLIVTRSLSNNSAVVSSGGSCRSFPSTSKVVFCAAVTFSSVIAVLTGISLALEPFNISLKANSLVLSSDDPDLAVRYWRFQCQINRNNAGAQAILLILALLEGLQLLRLIFLASLLRSKKLGEVMDVGPACNCSLLKIAILLGTAIIVLILMPDATEVMLAVSVSSNFFSMLNLAMIFLPKFIQKGGFGTKPNQLTVPRHHSSATRQSARPSVKPQ